MFKIIINEGTVVRESDGKVVAPCQSTEDADYQEYVAWINAGNEPEQIYSTPAEE